MAKIVNIVNGTGTTDLINGTYTATALVTGYDNSTISPSEVTVNSTTNEYAFIIAAAGTLTLHVTEDGTSSGTPVIGATFIRTDASGTEYGNLITTDASGNAIFNNVPYADTNAPTIYFKQTASDGYHEFSTEIQNTSLTTQASTLEIQNSPGTIRTITLADTNYENLPIAVGTITLTN